MSLPGYDAWLERPYIEAAEQAEAYLAWCNERNVDPDAPGAEDDYLEWVEDELYNAEPDPDLWRDEKYDRDRSGRDDD